MKKADFLNSLVGEFSKKGIEREFLIDGYSLDYKNRKITFNSPYANSSFECKTFKEGIWLLYYKSHEDDILKKSNVFCVHYYKKALEEIGQIPFPKDATAFLNFFKWYIRTHIGHFDTIKLEGNLLKLDGNRLCVTPRGCFWNWVNQENQLFTKKAKYYKNDLLKIIKSASSPFLNKIPEIQNLDGGDSYILHESESVKSVLKVENCNKFGNLLLKTIISFKVNYPFINSMEHSFGWIDIVVEETKFVKNDLITI